MLSSTPATITVNFTYICSRTNKVNAFMSFFESTYNLIDIFQLTRATFIWYHFSSLEELCKSVSINYLIII